ncbi:MAG: substrate-binding domain-containing protein [Candidatus Binataceae bacterium]
MAVLPGKKLREMRIAREISQTEMARRVGISRQALGAIESDIYLPGVEVALQLAEQLGTTVESLFGRSQDDQLIAECGSGATPEVNARVSLARVGGRLIAVPVPPTCVMLTPAAGLVARTLPKRRVEISTFRSRAEIDLTLIIAGCDPAVAILRDYLSRRQPPIEVAAIPGSSRDALTAVTQGVAHAAGVHLRDPESGEYNLAAAREAFCTKRFRIINFARWELGLATRPSGARVKVLDDLTRRSLKIINREVGAGARQVLDEALAADGIKASQLKGYDQLASGHLEVAAAIAGGAADAGVTIRLAAKLYGLHFEAWREERYDLVIPEDDFHSIPVQNLLEALNTRTLAHEISQLCSYDTSQMGAVALI